MDEREQTIRDMIQKGRNMPQIGDVLGVSRQRIYQLLDKYGIETLERKKHGFWKYQSDEHKWLWRIINSKPIIDKFSLFEYLKDKLPTTCPVLGLPLNYTSGRKGIRDDSPSIDRIDSTGEYTIDNVHIISFRANRIKNDGSLEELRAIVKYLEKENTKTS